MVTLTAFGKRAQSAADQGSSLILSMYPATISASAGMFAAVTASYIVRTGCVSVRCRSPFRGRRNRLRDPPSCCYPCGTGVKPKCYAIAVDHQNGRTGQFLHHGFTRRSSLSAAGSGFPLTRLASCQDSTTEGECMAAHPARARRVDARVVVLSVLLVVALLAWAGVDYLRDRLAAGGCDPATPVHITAAPDVAPVLTTHARTVTAPDSN